MVHDTDGAMLVQGQMGIGKKTIKILRSTGNSTSSCGGHANIIEDRFAFRTQHAEKVSYCIY
jgi:hypothetical protein